MTKRHLFLAGGAATLVLALVALPGLSRRPQDSADEKIAQLEQKVLELQERLTARLAGQPERMAERIQDRMTLVSERALARAQDALNQEHHIEVFPEQDSDNAMVVLGDAGGSWLGVESQEVNADNAKELKLPAERGVLLARIVPDSPAAKAGLKDNDVITEINGQRVEGAAQFRRMIHEIPAGRSAQLTVWRGGSAQTITVTLGSPENDANVRVRPFPRALSFQLPNVEIPEVVPTPGLDWNFELMPGARPRLGIDAEDLSGQLGAYFGAPDGEGVLVREVNPGSPAEKAGVKSGDVITSLNGERIRSLGELREKLAAKRADKTVKLSVLRNKSEMSVTVELPPPPSKTPRAISRRTNI